MKKAAKDYVIELLLDVEQYLYDRVDDDSYIEHDLIDRIAFVKEYLDKKDIQYVLKDGELFCHCEGRVSSCCKDRHEC